MPFSPNTGTPSLAHWYHPGVSLHATAGPFFFSLKAAHSLTAGHQQGFSTSNSGVESSFYIRCYRYGLAFKAVTVKNITSCILSFSLPLPHVRFINNFRSSTWFCYSLLASVLLVQMSDAPCFVVCAVHPSAASWFHPPHWDFHSLLLWHLLINF